jgi:hypothetical protein
MHIVKEAYMLTAKMDLLMKRLNDYTNEKAAMAPLLMLWTLT